MKFFLFMLNLLLSYSWKLAPPPKFCVNCVHFISNPTGTEYGKCDAFPIKSTTYLIDGIVKDIDYQYCENARKFETACGQSGNLYEPNRENEEIVPTIPIHFPKYITRHNLHNSYSEN